MKFVGNKRGMGRRLRHLAPGNKPNGSIFMCGRHAWSCISRILRKCNDDGAGGHREAGGILALAFSLLPYGGGGVSPAALMPARFELGDQ